MNKEVPQIPREIHQTWRGGRLEMEPCLRRCVESMESVNPGWDHRYYDDDGMRDAMADMPLIKIDNFNRLTKGVEKADVFRCAILYQRGGVYCDVDIEAIRPLDELLLRRRRGDQHYLVICFDFFPYSRKEKLFEVQQHFLRIPSRSQDYAHFYISVESVVGKVGAADDASMVYHCTFHVQLAGFAGLISLAVFKWPVKETDFVEANFSECF